MSIIVDGEFVQTDGNDYFIIKNVDSDLNLSFLKVDVDNGFWAKAWTGPMNLVLNRDWKIIESEIDKDKDKFNIIIQDILTPILNKVSVRDIYQS